MRISKTSLIGIVLSVFALPAMAKTTTPAQDSVCNVLEGKSFGICNAYCEAMDCDNPEHKASDKACQNKLKKWRKLKARTRCRVM